MEYCEWSKTQRGNTLSSSLPSESARSNQVPAFTSLAQQYGLPDDMYFTTPINHEEQSIEEFRSYVTSPVSPMGTNELKFWEVCELSDAMSIN